MATLTRMDTSVIGQWWWTVDRWTLLAIGLLIAIGGLMTLAASPAVAERIGYSSFHFAQRQLIYMAPALAAMFAVSLMTPRGIRRLSAIGLVAALVLTLATLFLGPETKGATRWLSLGPMSVQPSEFVKPFFVVFAAWMFAGQKRGEGLPGNLISIAVFAVILLLLLAQPDVGMAIVVSGVWCAQFFMAGLPVFWVGGLAALAIVGVFCGYFFIPHVTSRIDRFLDPASGDSFQIDTALTAFGNGGLLGLGPGEGVVKRVLPDAHSDFIFAVAGEEYGLFACLSIVALFAFVVLRGLARLLEEENLFHLLAAGGLLILFGLQAVINLGVNLHLLPTKGMTLPFISYGGSSLLALAIAMGMLLALTRRRPRVGGLS